MFGNKRLTLFCGHYGSGKTNIAVNAAISLKEKYDNVALADLDIVNPYFRTKDSSSGLGMSS
jgi:MinD-like ATPase involved in chromosome partitioning or flagellar assembly